jgi:chemosensory pili system protein ChpA (sensor histidine kinase/response regulator)
VLDAFDIGPLTWVHDEIKFALKQVVSHLDTYERDKENLSALKHALTHLNQVSGALDMVGLEGCKRFCFEIETLVSAVDKQVLPSSAAVFQQLKHSVLELEHYLEDLLNGEPDQSLRLYESLSKLAELRGEAIDQSVLFFPDLSQSLQKTTSPLVKPEDDASAAFFNTQRSLFQRALLSWLKTQNTEDLVVMQSALEHVYASQEQKNQRTFWWVAVAFLDVLMQSSIARQPNIKKIFRRIDQQLRAMESGAGRANQALMKDMLYFIAIAEASTPLLVEVHALFNLKYLIPNLKSSHRKKSLNETLMADEVRESKTIAPMLRELEAMKSSWTLVSEGEMSAFSTFVSQSQSLLNFADGLSHQATIKVVVALNVFAQVWDESGLQPSDDSLIEVAAGLALIEDALRDYHHINQDVQQHLMTQAQRIKNISDSLLGEDASSASISHELSEDTLIALAAQIKEALITCEQVFDGLFRNPAQVEILSQMDEPIKQMIAAFDILNMPVPMEVVSVSQHLIRMFGIQSATSSQFESLADSLSLLGLFVAELPRISASRLQALEDSLVPLTEALQQFSQAADELLEIQPLMIKPDEIKSEAIVDAEMLDIFLQEAEEVLASTAESIKALRVNITASVALADLRRDFHTLKGSGRMVGLSTLGELSWLVEALLNQLIENNITPDIKHIDFAEEVSVAIASHLVTLRAHGVVEVDLSGWLAVLTKLKVVTQEKLSAHKVEQVVIRGTHKINKALYDIFIEEAMQHLQVLKAAQLTLENHQLLETMEFVRRAAHTMASNAGTAGFKAIEELSRNFEFWLDLEHIEWSAESIKRFADCVTALQGMLDKAKALKQPKQVAWLLKDVKRAVLISNQPVQEVDVTNAQEDMVAVDISPLTQSAITIESALIFDRVDDGLLAMFSEEAFDLLSQTGVCLRNWQADRSTKIHAEDLQRALHTLKGSARMVGFADLGNAVHGMEDLVIVAINGKPENINFDALFDRLDFIANHIESKSAVNSAVIDEQAEVPISVSLPIEFKQEYGAQQLRLRADVLDRLINEAGEISISRSRIEREMQSFKQYALDLTESLIRLKEQLREMEIEAESTLQSRLAHLQEVHESFDPLEFDRFTRLQELTRLMAESVNDVSTIQHALNQNIDETEAALTQQSRMNRELQYTLINIRMVPFSGISERLHRIVRQTARELDKRVELLIDGEHVDVDRSVLEHIGGALEHLLRNAVAHGLETTDLRNKARKPLVGNITVKVVRENDEIIIHVSDDGTGIDLDKIRMKAEEQGILDAGQQISEQALLGIIFEPGFSTASVVTQIAGRGVGLDSVRSDVSAMGGRIDVANNEGAGAIFSIYLPVTLSVAQVVMVRTGSLVFALPAVMVEQVQKVKSAVLTEAVNAGYLQWNDKAYPFYYLGGLVGSEQMSELQVYTPLILLKSGQYLLALHVDEVLGNQELVMKPIGPQLARLPGVVGVSVLGDGQIIYMLNPIQIAHHEELVVGSVKISHAKKSKDRRKVALVVDDSLTMRKVLSRLLEREGYRVETATHGIDALQRLQEVSPNIILTDIEMPNMDGFELVRQLKSDDTTAKTPIIMISSRTAEKHQALAKTLGVNVFMGKPIQDEALIANITFLLA